MEVIEEHKVGYKKTKLGWIPDEWNISTINIISNYKKLNFNDGDWIESVHIIEEGIRIIQTGNIGIGRFIDKEKKKYISEESFSELKCNEIFEGDILVCRLADPSGRACRVPKLDDYKAVTSVDVSIFRPINSIADPNYLVHFFSTQNWLNEVKKRCAGSTRSRIARSELGKIKFYLPPLPEQQKIASILSDWDEAIEKTQTLIEKLQLRKKGLMQQLLTGKTRLDGFSEEWKEVSLAEIAERITKKNEELDDTVVTISAQRGFVKQEDFFNKRVASSTLSGYFLIEKGDFAYNKSYSNGYPMGAFKRLDDFDKAVVTTLYICFSIKDNVDSDFLLNYFEAGLMVKNLMRIAQEGGRAHGLLNIGLKDFFDLKLNIPIIEEQKAISGILNMVDKEITQNQNYLEQLQAQKKGLMQQLLTGKIRVKI